VPVAPETAAICELLDLNPLGLIGSGSLLIASSAPEAVEEALKDHGIPVAPIGRLLAREEGLWLTSRGERQPLIVPPRDELYRAITGA
jgi:hydrogenase maturation factor